MSATKVWNRDFLILWQGQLVSFFGDVVYAIALGFWILQTTGSTALMGALLAATSLPRVLASPFAGVLVDRTDRKRLLIAMDLVRGTAVVLVALAGSAGVLRIWMVFAAGVLIGLGGAFFSPAVTSVLPEIVPRDRLVQANASYSLISTGSSVLGNSAGGFLFQLLGAPILFLVNGLSYLVSAATLLFVRIPKHPPVSVERHFFAELGDGLKLVIRMRGLRNLFLAAGLLNFFGVMGLTLIMPFFQRTPGLGPARYGLAMAGMTGGMVLGFLASSAAKIPPAARFRTFAVCAYIQGLGLTIFPQARGFGLMVALGILSGIANAILNSFIMAIVQMTVPRTMLGKASALLMTLSGGLIPLSMAAGGILAGYFPIRSLISGSFVVMMLCFTPLMFSRSFRRFINFDPDKDSVESLRA
jgi:DHA3 family macrolide efflux protein-like MFS transporter